MLRSTLVGIGSGLRYAILPIFQANPDAITISTPITQNRPESGETGIDRVLDIFRDTEDGRISHELNSINQAGFIGMLAGGLWGGYLQSRITYMNYMENNQATVFDNHMDAKRHLQTQMSLGFAKGAFRWAWRMTLFTTTFVGLTTIVSVYRNKSSALEYVLAGSVAGAMYKSNLGLRGMIAGGCVGSFLGLIGGGLNLLALKITGSSMQDVRYFQYEWKKTRDDAVHAAPLKQIEPEETDLIMYIRPEGVDNNLNTIIDTSVPIPVGSTYTTAIKSENDEKKP